MASTAATSSAGTEPDAVVTAVTARTRPASRPFTRLASVVIAVTIPAAARSQVDRIPYASAGAADSARHFAGHDFSPPRTADQIGLPPLSARALPRGWREVRLELVCDLCSPEYLVRLVRDPAGRVSGEAYVVWLASVSVLADASDAMDTARHRDAVAWADSLARTVCATRPAAAREELDVTDDASYSWCRARARAAGDWATLLSKLDSLGVTTAGTDTGYSPTPPAFASDSVTIDGRRRLLLGGHCNDIAGRALIIESRVASEYRNAHFWCLEAAKGREHERAAEALRLLWAAVFPP